MEDKDKEYMSAMEDNNSETHKTVSLMDNEYIQTRNKQTRCLERFNQFMINDIESKRNKYKGVLHDKLEKIKQGEKNQHTDNYIGGRDNKLKSNDLLNYENIVKLIDEKMNTYGKSKVEIEQKIQTLQM